MKYSSIALQSRGQASYQPSWRYFRYNNIYFLLFNIHIQYVNQYVLWLERYKYVRIFRQQHEIFCYWWHIHEGLVPVFRWGISRYHMYIYTVIIFMKNRDQFHSMNVGLLVGWLVLTVGLLICRSLCPKRAKNYAYIRAIVLLRRRNRDYGRRRLKARNMA